MMHIYKIVAQEEQKQNNKINRATQKGAGVHAHGCATQKGAGVHAHGRATQKGAEVHSHGCFASSSRLCLAVEGVYTYL